MHLGTSIFQKSDYGSNLGLGICSWGVSFIRMIKTYLNML